MRTNTIYKIDCRDCNGCYIGQTKQYTHKRMKEHKKSLHNIENNTALTQHCHNNQHQFDFDNFEILDEVPNLSQRLFHEMFHIKKNTNSVNFRTDIENLSNIYSTLIN